MWRAAPEEMKKQKIQPSFSYDPRNCHKGEMPGWPKEVKNFTDNKMKRILFACYKSGELTYPGLKSVRKSMSYLYELKTGGSNSNKTANWPGVRTVWKTFRWVPPTPVKPTTETTKPTLIPTPQDLKKAFTRPWTPKTKMKFVDWTVGQVAAWDWAVCGSRSREDFKRIKNAPRHALNIHERWHASAYRGGRAKLCGEKKGTRPWWVYRVCLCPGQQHISPPRGFGDYIDKGGNQCFFGGIYIPKLLKVWGYAKKFGDTYPQILKICGCRMLRLAFQRGGFLFAEPQKLKIFRLRRAKIHKTKILSYIQCILKKCRPLGRRNFWGQKVWGYAENLKKHWCQ